MLNAAIDALLDHRSPLQTRIISTYLALGISPPIISDHPQLDAARCALHILHHVQRVLDTDQGPSPIPTRDITLLCSLLSFLFQYGINPLLSRLAPLWQPGTHSSVDIPALSDLLSSLFSLLFPRGTRAQPAQTIITTTVLQKHVPDLLSASMALAWLPKSMWTQDSLSLHTLRPSIFRLLEFLPLPQIMSDLGAVLSTSPPPPPHVRKICSSLLTKSLLRPTGVRALFSAVFGDQDGSDDLRLEKYEHTARILMVVPAGLHPEAYLATIVPRLIDLLSNNAPATHRRAAAFSISCMLDSQFPHRASVSALISTIIHHPILHDSNVGDSQENQEGSRPTAALSILTILLLNTDPSPVLITQVLSPVVPALYALLFCLDTTKASDPILKESVKGLLATWGRLVEAQDGINTLWSVIQSERVYWTVDISGNIRRGTPAPTKFTLTPEDTGKEDEILGENLLDLYPDPTHFVQYVKSLDRLDVASELFVRLLEAYRLADTEQDSDPSRALLYLQMIVQIQTQLCSESSPTNIFRKPEHMLSFVKHSLMFQAGRATPSPLYEVKHSRGLGLEDLRIIGSVDDFGGGNGDDEPAEMASDQVDNIMTGTAIDLLLATLEANPDLSAWNTPVLNEIFLLLEPLSSDASDSIRGLAREARMVITARLASGSTSWSAPRRREEDDPQEIYQKALRLLQDPILPVRAHGLLLLRQLVSSRPREATPGTDPALMPAITSIFMQSVQDDDSYIFLNAVQGLSAMVDAFGKDVLGNLLDTYTHHLSPSSAGMLSKPEVDTKVRVGEALAQIIRRCGDALGLYADIVVPRLILVFRSRYFPIVLRTSAVSLLTECINTSRMSVLGYIDDLAASMIDVLQVEMISAVQLPSKGDGSTDSTGERKEMEILDSNPTAIDSKLAPLRRAALHFWTSLLNQLMRTTYNGDMVERLPPALLKRAKVTLGYVASTDEDGRVRVMAREASEAIDQLNKAMLGI